MFRIKEDNYKFEMDKMAHLGISFGLWTFLVLIRSSNFKYKNIFNTKNETDGTESSPFGDLSWNQWVEQVRKKYQA